MRIPLAVIVAGALVVCGRVNAQSPPSGVADIKMLAKGGMSDEVILSQIRKTHAVYRLSTADILDLKESGVSEKVIDAMINTASGAPMPPPPARVAPPIASPPPPPPPPAAVQVVVEGSEPPTPIVEEVGPAPGPEYVWVTGAWVWRHHHWEWIRGHWVFPPRRGAVWIEGRWDHRGGRVVWVDGFWR